MGLLYLDGCFVLHVAFRSKYMASALNGNFCLCTVLPRYNLATEPSPAQTMIRRPPTMIPMTDADIQDIRALVAQQKAAHETRQKVLLKMKKLTEVPDPVAEDSTATLFRQLTDKVREHDERHKRLGIPPGKSSS